MIRDSFCRATGYRFYYRVRLTYRTIDHRPLSDVTMTMATVHPKYTDHHRSAKRALSKVLIRETPKRLLCNGEIVFEPLMYLGFWRAVNRSYIERYTYRK